MRHEQSSESRTLIWRRIFLFLLSVTMVCCGLASPVPQQAPLNPNFVKYRDELRQGLPRPIVTAEGYFLGYIPPPVGLSHIAGRSAVLAPLSLPGAYDLRTLGRLTAVRDQGACGSCWTFATYGSLESWLLTAGAGAWDLSENNLKECHGFAYGPCEGGHEFMSAAYLARRSGPINEPDDPYVESAVGCKDGLVPPRVLRYVLWLPDGATTDIKQAIITYGAVSTSMYWHSSYYRSSDYTYYYNGAASSNHAVALVGWDDAKATAAPSPGAWIVRNSWGSGWGQGGYFYISYSDTKVARGNAVFIEAVQPAAELLYGHDTLGWVTNWGYGSDTAWGANVFSAGRAGNVAAVGFYASTLNTAYLIQVRRGGPTGTVVHSQSGAVVYPGYHTVDLTSPVSVAAGEQFTVVVRFNTPGYNWPVPAECVESGYSDNAVINPGESYISSAGTSWTDMYNLSPRSNACIKAVVRLPATSPTAARFRVDRATGDVLSDGTYYGSRFYSGSADIAEWVPVSEPVEPGDVLELDPTRPGHYRLARGPCSHLVAGVVSTQPGFVLGSSSAADSGLPTYDSALLALLGIVPVKVTDEGGPIRPGDLLVASSTPGHAMRWGGAGGHGCVFVGKALEAHGGGTGMITVLLMR